MTVTVPSIPTPVPQASDPLNFDARADAYHTALPGVVSAQNAQNAENNALNNSNNAAAAITNQAFAAGLANAAANAQLAIQARDQALAGLGAADQSVNLAQLAYGLSGAYDQAAIANRRIDDVRAYLTQSGVATITQAASESATRTYASVAVALPRPYPNTQYQVVVECEAAAPFLGCEGNVLVQNRATNGFVLAITGSATTATLRWEVLHLSAQ